MEFFKTFYLENGTILVRKGMAIEPNMTLKQGKVISVHAVSIHGSIHLDGQEHLFDEFTFCCKHQLEQVYQEINEPECILLLENLKKKFRETMKTVKYGI
jgi:hypothetical protein